MELLLLMINRELVGSRGAGASYGMLGLGDGTGGYLEQQDFRRMHCRH